MHLTPYFISPMTPTRLLLFCVFSACSAANALLAASVTPANPKSTVQTQAVLNYISGLEAKTEKRLLSGQFTDFGDNGKISLLEPINRRNGHWPALAGFDYVDFVSGSGGLATHGANQNAIEYWKAGGLVTVGVHLYNPANPKKGGLRDKGVNLNDLLQPGPTHDAWMTELDTLAAGLQELKDAGVVVLWRPFHEMNGEWFWWGAKPPADFIKVWQHMFRYFTDTKKLDNLLWVYGPNHRDNANDYYPGDHFIDLVGLDAYTDHVDPQHIKGYDAVAKRPKPFGFTEYGPHGAEHPPGDYDYRRFLAGIKQHFPRSVFFMSWNNKWSLASNQNVAEFLNDPWIVNREDLPPGLTGKTR
jgi:mannan endo-1,4-beta-mannosidase